MNCDCIKIVQEELRKEYPEAEIGTWFTFPDMKEVVCVNFTYLPEGKKREKKKVLLCNFCPFCGKKIEEVLKQEERDE